MAGHNRNSSDKQEQFTVLQREKTKYTHKEYMKNNTPYNNKNRNVIGPFFSKKFVDIFRFLYIRI